MSTRILSILFLLLLLLWVLPAWAQGGEKYLSYQITGDVAKSDLIKSKDSLSRVEQVSAILNELYAEGYLGADIYEQRYVPDTLYVRIATGMKFNWLGVNKGNVDPVLLLKAGYDERRFQNRPFQYLDVVKLFDGLISQAENEGFPFASVKLDSIRREGNDFFAALKMDLGPKIAFDTLRISGNSKTNRMYLARYLQILPGEPFSQKKVEQAVRQIKNLPFLRWSGEPEISFQNEEATLYLPINDRRINTLDGIIGFLPNEFEQNSLLITGQFDLGLYNVGGKGRNYLLNWQRLSQYSQNLRVSAVEPMVLGSMIDVGATFSLLKEDTTFLNRDFRLDFGYRFKSDHYVKFFGRRQSGDLLATANLREIQELPEFADFRFNNYGIQYQLFQLDDMLLPRRGYYGDIEFAIGNKEIIENTGLPTAIYEGLDLKTIQFYIRGEVFKHFYFNSNWGLMTRLSGGILENRNLLGNDLYRLGGLRSIRGFNENFFFANNFTYFNIEPRFYFDTYSYFMIFVDGGRLQNRVQGLKTDYPFATGLGFSLETGSGIFNFIYAMGGANGQDFALNLSKIHFGYTGRF